jgi:hypothetical protein
MVAWSVTALCSDSVSTHLEIDLQVQVPPAWSRGRGARAWPCRCELRQPIRACRMHARSDDRCQRGAFWRELAAPRPRRRNETDDGW